MDSEDRIKLLQLEFFRGPLSGKPAIPMKYSDRNPDKVVLDRGQGLLYLDSMVSVSALEDEDGDLFSDG